MSIIRFILDLKKLKLEKSISELFKVGLTIFAAFITYKAITGFVSILTESSFSSKVMNEAFRIKNGKETSIIEYFYQQDKENTCSSLVRYLDIYKEAENTNIIRLEVIPKFCLKDKKEDL
jgi:hypothetical protein|nr:MAG TPA: hypothetical protein [Bacteriophage sp.]